MSEEKIQEDKNISKEDEDEKNKALKTIAKGGSIVFFGLVFAKFFGYLFRVIVARFLGAEIYGLYSLGLAAFSILTTVSLLGVASGIRRFIAYHKGKGEDKVRGIFKTGLKISMPLGIIFSVILIIFGNQLGLILFDSADMGLVLRIFGFLIPFKVLLKNLESISMGLKRVEYYVYSRKIIPLGSKFLLVILFIFLGFELLGVLAAFFIATILGLISIIYFTLFKLDYFNFSKSSFSIKKMFLYSWPLIIAAIFIKVIKWTDVLMMGHFLTESQVGIYNAALPTAMILPFFLSAVSKIIFPVFSELYGEGKLSEFRRIYQVSTKWIFAATLPFFMIMFLFPSQLMSFLFGAEFVPAALPLSILALAYFYYASLGSLDRVIKSIGKTKVYALVMGVSAAINIFLNWLLIPIYGMTGGAIATAVAVIIYSTLWLLLAYKELKLVPFTLSYLKVALSGLISVSITYFGLKYLIESPTIPIYILAFVIFVSIYAFLCLAMKVLDSEDIIIMKAAERKVGIDLKWLKNIIRKFA